MGWVFFLNELALPYPMEAKTGQLDPSAGFAFIPVQGRFRLFCRGREVCPDQQCYVQGNQVHRQGETPSFRNRSIKQLVQDGRDRDSIEAAIVHLAVALKFLEERAE